MIGRQIARYRILEELGSGGMGVVYRAHDGRLERDVALKLVQPGLLGDTAARSRFRKEALALSQLNHPNIATLFDFDSADGVDFLVMEHIEGASLEEKLREGPLPLPEGVRLGVQLAEGLQAAHARGVVHRDLKPANIRITSEGRLKILDFGLARLLPAASPGMATGSTAALGAVGTLAYMAPELLGGGVADERSDVYAAGVVLYEMAAGRRPFTGESAIDLMYAILHRVPQPPCALRPEISPALERVILKAIDGDRERRQAGAAALLEELRDVQRAPSDAQAKPGRIEALAVLPLENLSGDPAQEFFADGMTEALIAELARLGGLRVISRTSAMRYKGVRRSLPDIARELKVDAVVEGTVLRAGTRVRITVQLIHAATDTHMWTERYERDMGDILDLQSEVARAVAREVQLTLSPQAQHRLARKRSVDPEAFDAYLRGRNLWNRRTEEAMRQSIEQLNRAIAKDPSYALAYVGLAEAYCVLGYFCVLPPRETFPRAKAAAERALEVDETAVEARVSLAYVHHYYEWEWDRAEEEYRRVIELIPNYAIGHQWYLNLLTTFGRYEEALEHGRKARELDPLSLIITTAANWPYFFMGDYDRVIAEFHTVEQIDPRFVPARLWRAQALEMKGQLDEALAELRVANEIAASPWAQSSMARVLARAGDTVEARRILDGVMAESAYRYVSPFFVALVWVAMKDLDQAMIWLERAYEDRSHWLTTLDIDPRLEPLRSDPRFQGLRRRVGIDRVPTGRR